MSFRYISPAYALKSDNRRFHHKESTVGAANPHDMVKHAEDNTILFALLNLQRIHNVHNTVFVPVYSPGRNTSTFNFLVIVFLNMFVRFPVISPTPQEILLLCVQESEDKTKKHRTYMSSHCHRFIFYYTCTITSEDEAPLYAVSSS